MLSSWVKAQDLGVKIPNVSKSRAASRERMMWEPRVAQEGSPKRSGDMDGLLLGSIKSSSHGEVSKITPVSIDGSQSGDGQEMGLDTQYRA